MRYVIAFVAVVGWLAGAAMGGAQEPRSGRSAVGRAEEPRAGQVVALEVLVADVGGGALGEGEVTAAKVLELVQQGKQEAAARIGISLLENAPGVVNFSESVPVATGRQDFGGGFGGGGGRGQSTSYTMQNHGTSVQATARVEPDGTIVLELQAERSRLVANRPAGEEAGAANIAATKTTQARISTTTRLASGKPAIVGSQQTGVGKDVMHTYFVLTATVPEGGKAAAATDNTQIKMLTLANARAVELGKTVKEVLTSLPFKLSADERTNSLIVTGPPDVLEIIRNLVARLDVQT